MAELSRRVTVGQAAKILGCHRTTVQAQIRKGKIRATYHTEGPCPFYTIRLEEVLRYNKDTKTRGVPRGPKPKRRRRGKGKV